MNLRKLSTRDAFFSFMLIFIIGVPALQYSAIGIAWIYNEKRLLQIGLFAILACTFFLSKRIRTDSVRFCDILPTSVRYGLLGVLLLGVTSSFVAEFSEWAFLEVGHYLLIVIFTFVVAGITYSNTDKALFYLFVAVLGLTSVYLFRTTITYFLYQFGDYPLWPGSETSIGLFGFADKRFFNHIQTWTLSLLISLGFYYWNYSTRRKIAWLLGILISGWGMLAIASGGRGTILGVGLGFFVVLYLLKSERWKFFKFNLGLTVPTILGYYICFELLAKGTNYTLARGNSSGRFSNWLDILPDIISRPILGYGPMHYNSMELNNWLGAPHSWLFQFGYEWGVIVALILSGLIVIGLYSFYTQLRSDFQRDHSQRNHWIKLGLFWSVISVFIHSFFSGLINTALSQVWFILIVGASLGVYFKKNNYPKNSSSFFKQSLLIVLTIFPFICFLNWANKHSLELEKINRNYIKETDANSIPTRYWQAPKIGYQYNKEQDSLNE